MQASQITFGVEIECYVPTSVSYAYIVAAIRRAGFSAEIPTGGIHTTSSAWKVVRDASLNGANGFHGVEVVSPILRGDAGHAEMIAVAGVVKALGAKVAKDCGFHVHCGVRGASVGAMRNIAKMFLRYESQMDKLCPPSRQNNRFCNSNLRTAGGNIAEAFRRIDAARDVAGISGVMNGGYMGGYSSYRYHKLNFCSHIAHGTVEFRQAAGTVEGDKMSAWVKACVALVAVAFSLRVVTKAEVATFDDLCAKVDATTATFLRDRAARLAALRP